MLKFKKKPLLCRLGFHRLENMAEKYPLASVAKAGPLKLHCCKKCEHLVWLVVTAPSERQEDFGV